MFTILSKKHRDLINTLVENIKNTTISDTANGLHKIIEQVHKDIPEKKRISYGRYSIIKAMGRQIYPLLYEKSIDVLDLSKDFFQNNNHNEFVRSLSIQLIIFCVGSEKVLNDVLPLVEKAAMDEHWIVRECSAGFVRKLIKQYPENMHSWYMKMVCSENPMQRRFACESLRPVADNGWFKNRPEYVFPIISNLYEEHEVYPRTSIGNALSDWMRIDEELTLAIVDKLAKSHNKDSNWIAHRACRNLVKKKPILVMDMLGIDHYKYKDRNFRREQFED